MPVFEPDLTQALGLDDSHIDYVSAEKPIHKALVEPLMALKSAAQAAGFCVQIASGYRSFEQQLHIWNAKAQGERPVLGNDERPLPWASLDDTQRLFALLRWSALPGTSRHHWGCDLDLYDPQALPPGYRLQLVSAEYEGCGPLAAFNRWLQAHQDGAGEFFRPYERADGAVGREPWHWSFRALAEGFEPLITLEALQALLADSPIALKDAVLAHLPHIFRHYVQSQQN
jgi:LAS superfamily LD-carboxypeptidase LdcB